MLITNVSLEKKRNNVSSHSHWINTRYIHNEIRPMSHNLWRAKLDYFQQDCVRFLKCMHLFWFPKWTLNGWMNKSIFFLQNVTQSECVSFFLIFNQFSEILIFFAICDGIWNLNGFFYSRSLVDEKHTWCHAKIAQQFSFDYILISSRLIFPINNILWIPVLFHFTWNIQSIKYAMS